MLVCVITVSYTHLDVYKRQDVVIGLVCVFAAAEGAAAAAGVPTVAITGS